MENRRRRRLSVERLPRRLGGHLRQRGGRADGAGEEEHDTYEEQDGDRKAHCALHGEAVTSDGQTLGGPPGSQQQAEIWGGICSVEKQTPDKLVH